MPTNSQIIAAYYQKVEAARLQEAGHALEEIFEILASANDETRGAIHEIFDISKTPEENNKELHRQLVHIYQTINQVRVQYEKQTL